MIIYFRGRKTGKWFATPVRYKRVDGAIQCFTASANNWWKNIRDDEETALLVGGLKQQYIASVVTENHDLVRTGIKGFLEAFPNDAPYYEIRLNRDRTPVIEDLDRASLQTVMVEFRLAS